MSFSDVMTTEYWGVPLWGWIVFAAGLVLIIVIAKGAMGKKKAGDEEAKKIEGDVEAGNLKLPEGEPTNSSSPTAATANNFARDAPLPPPAPSETSHKG